MSDNEIPDASEISIPSSVEQALAGRVVVNDDATHNTELRELVKSFRIKGKWANENENYNYAFGREDSADELEEVIDRYE